MWQGFRNLAMTTKVCLIGIKTERWQKRPLLLPRGKGVCVKPAFRKLAKRLRYWTSVVENDL
jgi:hypothetical protein